MVGLALAAAGLGLRQLTGSGVWDGAASIAIGGLLVVVAVRLGLDSRRPAASAGPPTRRLQQVIRDEIEHMPGVDGMLELLTMHMGPDHLIVAARVAFSDQIGAGTVEDLSERIDRRLSERLPVTSARVHRPHRHRQRQPGPAAARAGPGGQLATSPPRPSRWRPGPAPRRSSRSGASATAAASRRAR